MKLSEAILKGCEMTPKQHLIGGYGQAGIATCAIGAAMEAVGEFRSIGKLFTGLPMLIFPELRNSAFADQPGYAPSKPLFAQVIALNDCEEWSRERIASWLQEKGL